MPVVSSLMTARQTLAGRRPSSECALPRHSPAATMPPARRLGDCRAAPYSPGKLPAYLHLGGEAQRGRAAIEAQGGRRPPVRLSPPLAEKIDEGVDSAGVEVHFGREAPLRPAGACRVGDGPCGPLTTAVAFVEAKGACLRAGQHHKPPRSETSPPLVTAERLRFDEAARRLARLLDAERPSRHRLLTLHIFFAHAEAGFRWLFSCASWSPSATYPEGACLLYPATGVPDFRERALRARRLLTEHLEIGEGQALRSVGVASFDLVDAARRGPGVARPAPDVDPRTCRGEAACYACLTECVGRGVWHVCRGCGAGLLCDECLAARPGEARACGACREPWPSRRVECG